MEKKDFILTAADYNAISLNDMHFINNKGAALYKEDTYYESVEYYRLASAMGDSHATSNLGYCNLYGRSIEQNLSLAIAYFKIAAMKKDVDAAYKLGDIYGSDKWGIKDSEISVYYYTKAAEFLTGSDSVYCDVYDCRDLQIYPSLCFALGREMLPGGNMSTDIETAYQYLKHAEIGYERELANGGNMYKNAYSGVVKLIEDNIFDDIREKYDDLFSEEDDFYID